MRKKTPIQLIIVAGVILLCMVGMIVRLYTVIRGDQVAEASVRQGKYHLHVPLSSGYIYDRNLTPLNNSEQTVLAVVSPTPETLASLFTKLRDRNAVSAQLQKNMPFVCELTEETAETPHLRILHGTSDSVGALPAQHLLGYRQNGECVAGLERAYAEWLTACDFSADLTFTVSGRGEVLAGAESRTAFSGQQGGGIVTTLNREIQKITEQALQTASPHTGAAIVLDCKSGEILGCASTPVYDPEHLNTAMNDPQSPFLNRALCAYSVGSIFKLVTASAALESGISDLYMYECEGATSIYGQTFRCHKADGHGLLNMEQATVNSCNPYFISLSQIITAEKLHDTADNYGFGKQILLADGLYSDGGYLPSVSELQVAAEKANFSFGQGKLLATPMQIAAMTACIANDGVYHVPHLVAGMTADGINVQWSPLAEGKRVIAHETALTLHNLMRAVIYRSETTNAKPCNTLAAGKTSTAQTGHYADDGTEYCHAWMTGFFPAYHPQYTVTVMIENGGSGNQAAAPVFRQIAEQITDKIKET
jgi:penicillin-binding protein 2